MDKFGISQPISRLEDARFLTGQGRYVDDIAPKDALHGFVLRSPVAHAEIATLNVVAARAMPGVHLILTCADLEEAGIDIAMPAALVQNRDGSTPPAVVRPFLAKDRVRFVGEAIAMVFAETLDQAKDAAEAIEFDFEELEPHLSAKPGGPAIHAETPENVAFDWGAGDAEGTKRAFEAAAQVIRLEVSDNRIIVNSLEPRGCYGEMEDGRLHVAVNGQGVWGLKSNLVRKLGLKEEDVRVTNPDVGGGFGMKGMTYPEYYVLAEAVRRLGRPCRWMSERTEAMLSDNAGRDLISTAELAFDAEHRVIGYRCDVLSNLGAYNSEYAQHIQSSLAMKVLTGVYDIPQAYMRVRGVFTNTTQVDAYRGAGRPEAIYTLERTMDFAAREMNLDPWDLRRINFIRPDQMPYRAVSGEVYDVGEFERVLRRAVVESDREGFNRRRIESAVNGNLRGVGLCFYIEAILGDPSEGAKITFNEDGTVNLFVGTQSNGQGHETVYAQILHELSGIPIEAIRIIQGDSDLIANGGGTGGSRSVTTQGTATRATVTKMIAAFTPFVADQLGVDEADVSFEDGAFRAEGANAFLTIMEAADAAREADLSELLSHEGRDTLPGRSFPNGAHVCEVEIDPITGVLNVDRYTVVDDFGVLMNPRLAEGQVHGGVAQGIGQAVTEHVVFDEDGQLLTASFMDYSMPRADNLPMIAFHTEPVPSKNNAFGMKGCGEAGTVGALAAVSNAVIDAVWASGIKQVEMPYTPYRVWRALNRRGAAG